MKATDRANRRRFPERDAVGGLVDRARGHPAPMSAPGRRAVRAKAERAPRALKLGTLRFRLVSERPFRWTHGVGCTKLGPKTLAWRVSGRLHAVRDESNRSLTCPTMKSLS